MSGLLRRIQEAITYDRLGAVGEVTVGTADLDVNHLGGDGRSEGKTKRKAGCCWEEHGCQRVKL